MAAPDRKGRQLHGLGSRRGRDALGRWTVRLAYLSRAKGSGITVYRGASLPCSCRCRRSATRRSMGFTARCTPQTLSAAAPAVATRPRHSASWRRSLPEDETGALNWSSPPASLAGFASYPDPGCAVAQVLSS